MEVKMHQIQCLELGWKYHFTYTYEIYHIGYRYGLLGYSKYVTVPATSRQYRHACDEWTKSRPQGVVRQHEAARILPEDASKSMHTEFDQSSRRPKINMTHVRTTKNVTPSLCTVNDNE